MGRGEPWHSRIGLRPVSSHASQGGSWSSPWFLGEGGPQQGDGKRGLPAFPAGPAWLERSVVDLVFTKHKAAHLEPLSQALGPVPGVRSPAAPVPGWGLGWAHGHSGPSWAEWQGAYSSPEAPPLSPLCRNCVAQALLRLGGDLAPWKSSVQVGSPSPRAPHHGSPERISMTQCSCFIPALSKWGSLVS